MRAIRLRSQIDKDHTLSLRLPDDVAEGPAEVIVLVEETPAPEGHVLSDFLARLEERDRKTRTKEEIDRQIESERESWGS